MEVLMHNLQGNFVDVMGRLDKLEPAGGGGREGAQRRNPRDSTHAGVLERGVEVQGVESAENLPQLEQKITHLLESMQGSFGDIICRLERLEKNTNVNGEELGWKGVNGVETRVKGPARVRGNWEGDNQQIGQNWAKMKLPAYDGEARWAPFFMQIEVIFRMNGCFDDQVKGFKVVESLRGRAREYFSTLPKGVAGNFELLSNYMMQRFGREESGLESRSKLYKVSQKVEESIVEFAERVSGLATVGLAGYGLEVQGLTAEFFLMGLRNKNAALAVLDKEPGSMGEAIGLLKKYDAQVTVLGMDWKDRSMEGMNTREKVRMIGSQGCKSGGQRGGNMGVTCQWCKGFGHGAKDCDKFRQTLN